MISAHLGVSELKYKMKNNFSKMTISDSDPNMDPGVKFWWQIELQYIGNKRMRSTMSLGIYD